MKQKLIVVALSMLALAGCSYGQTTPAKTTSPSSSGQSTVTTPAGSLVVKETAHNTSVNLAVGQSLVINLPANVTTGYSWNLTTTPNPTTLEKVMSSYEASVQSTPVVGGGGQEIWQFKGLKAGTTTLTLSYAHSWEISQSTTDTFTLTVTVK